jgi:hypothetical protein
MGFPGLFPGMMAPIGGIPALTPEQQQMMYQQMMWQQQMLMQQQMQWQQLIAS